MLIPVNIKYCILNGHALIVTCFRRYNDTQRNVSMKNAITASLQTTELMALIEQMSAEYAGTQ